MGGSLLVCSFLNPALLFLGPQNTLDRPRWYFIISAHSVYSVSIITPYMSFNSALFFSNYMSDPLSGVGFPCHVF